MLVREPAEAKRKKLRKLLASGKLLQFPGAFSPFIALMAEREGFEGVYISGATLSNDLGLPDVGLTTMSEVWNRSRAIAQATVLPSLVDIDTGFGETMNVARTIAEIEQAGLSGVHLEDQVNPKRCGHLDNKQLVDVSEMARKLRAAIDAKRDPDFLVMARTDARGVEGLDGALKRAAAYVDAGAEAIFPEGLQDESEFERFRKQIKVPLLANMTEFGKSKLLDTQTLSRLGINLVIYPVTFFRLAMHAAENGLKRIKAEGTQEGLIDSMQTRKHLYEILKYEEYNRFDQNVYNFKV